MRMAEYSRFPLFQGMTEEAIRNLVLTAGCLEKNFKKGNMIYEENEIIHSMGMILEGHVYMVKEDLWGEKTILVRMGPGELFGENFACSHQPAASVAFQAAEPSSILFIPYERLIRHAGDQDILPFVKNLIAMMTSKSQELMKKINITSKKTLREKILCFLSLEAEKYHSLSFTIPYSREDLAEYLMANRSALSRELKAMERDGLIRVHRREIQILKSIR